MDVGDRKNENTILSGKSGTETLVSVNLAAVSEKATYIDCDVEEANGHLFLSHSGFKKKVLR